ncbi:integrative conjugal element protein [Mycoplasma feriruminatoris]|uniref:Uncharacterized protein n=1 Tax=Mycoplasma feriruminatoris TaxID=1179777 RepID=A0AAX3TGK9_9MOLU|nr:integrative conjugal element protein [Mycoplasma feriruminatoris]WFQ93048.1 hypothetical protein MFERI14822_00841 [Mycoplasma feriruminatoris]
MPKRDYWKNCTPEDKAHWEALDEEYKKSKTYIPGTYVVPDTYDGFEDDLQDYLRSLADKEAQKTNN